MTALRGALYVVAVVSSLAILGRFAVVKDRAARLLAATMGAWALNALILLALLAFGEMTGDMDPSWRRALLTANALLLAAAPAAMYVLFPAGKGDR